MAVRKRVKEILTGVFESYGFEPLETPALEYQSVLLGKYGQEADKLVYTFDDKGGRKVGLRYDLTVPLARVAAIHQSDLPVPFKRYQIQRVWRADKPQKGRYREIEMCDVDILNSASPMADAEILAVIVDALKRLGMKQFTIRLNSRQVLFSLIEAAGISENLKFSIIQTIDKLDKKTRDEVSAELERKGLNSEQISDLFSTLAATRPAGYLEQVLEKAKSMGVADSYLKFDSTLARGLDYYTGPIFETVVEEPKIGSITGGGRYDQLIKQLGGPDWPAVGTTLGLDRICDVIIENKLWPDLSPTSTKVFVTLFDESLVESSLSLAKELREGGIITEVYLDPRAKLDKQLKYADRKGIPFVVILGPEEVKKNVVTVKNMTTGEQKTVPLAELPKILQD